MVHPATLRTVRTAVVALDVPLDIGFVFPPRPGEQRGFGQWTNRDLSAAEIIDMLSRAAAANARGGNIFIRLGPSAKDAHPGVLMLDDVAAGTIEQLAMDGFEPCLTVETSPNNFQAWIRLASGCIVPYPVMAQAIRQLVQGYGADKRAVSPRQPGRLVGFTNRKSRHQMEDGRYPFVRLASADPGRVASNGGKLLDGLSRHVTAAAAAGAAPKTPQFAAAPVTKAEDEVDKTLDAIHADQKARIDREVIKGSRPISSASTSEIDFAMTRAALSTGIADSDIVDWIKRNRSRKETGYPERTVNAAASWSPKMK